MTTQASERRCVFCDEPIASTDPRLPWAFFVPAALRDINHPEPATTDAHRSVIVFGHLTLEIAGSMSVGGRQLPPLDNGTFMLAVWPGDDPRPLSWPPTHTFNGNEIFQFMEIPEDTKLPNPGAE